MNEGEFKGSVTGENKIKIISRGENHWRVRIVYPTLETSDSEMVRYLREAKKLIYITDGIPTKSLKFEEVLSKTSTDDGIAVDVSISRIEVERGKPVVRLKEMKLSDDLVFENMVAVVDFSYADENNQPMTVERIRSEIDDKKIHPEMCNFSKLETEVKRVTDKNSYSKSFIIAEGKLPDIGEDAGLEYTFAANLGSAGDMDDYRERRKVKQGDVICRRIPPESGDNPGVDVLGKEIPPRKGADFELVPGNGVELSHDGTLLTATIDGMATLKELHRTILDKMGEREVLEKVEIEVRPLIQVDGSKVENLNTDDSVEITGTLRKGAKINTRGELFLNGDVDDGAVVRARSDVMINGDIRGGDVASDDSIHATRDALRSNIAAKNNVVIDGGVENSIISGKRVTLGSVFGSEIIASRRVTVRSTANGSGIKSKVKVNCKDFYLKIIETNEKTITGLRENLEKVVALIGGQYVDELNETNLQQVLTKCLQDHRVNKGTELSSTRVSSIKHLLESVLPIKRIIDDKIREIQQLQAKIDEEGSEKVAVIVQENINDSLCVKMGDKVANISPHDEGTLITPDSEGNIQCQPLREQKKKVVAS